MGDQPRDTTPTSTNPISKESQDEPELSSGPGTPSSSEGPPTPSNDPEISHPPAEKTPPNSEYASTASSVHGSTTPASTAPTETSCPCGCQCDCGCDSGARPGEELCGYCARFCR